MNEIAKCIKKFCEENDGYNYVNNYSGRFMFGEICVGIIVDRSKSPMKMLMELTHYFDDNNVDDSELMLSNPAYDDMGLDTVCYFPFLKE